MPKPSLNIVSTYGKLFGIVPYYSRLCVCGCLCYPWLKKYACNKLEDWSHHCVFLVYSFDKDAFKCYHPTTKQNLLSQHVDFVESIFFSYNSIDTLLERKQPIISKLTTINWISTSPNSLSTDIHGEIYNCWKNGLLRFLWHNFKWDPFVYFERSKLFCVLFREYIEIIYSLVKNDNQGEWEIRI